MRLCKPWQRAFGCVCVGSLLTIFILLWTTPTPFIEAVVDRYDLQLPTFYSRSAPAKPHPTPPIRYHLATDTSHTTKNKAFIQGTYMRGKEVSRFFSHQDCFSETGEWELDETPRAMCCKVIVYHTVHFTRHCDYNISYCNASAPAPVVYASPLPPPLAKQIGQAWTTEQSREVLKWFWQTSPSCPMLPFDREDFCKRIGRGRNFMIAGDSINYQIFITFLNFLRAEFTEYQHAFLGDSNEAVCGDVLGGAGFTMGWTNTGRLNATHVSHFIELWQIEILLMNRGAWLSPDVSFVAELQEVVLLLQLRYPHLLVIFRNTPPGHADCMSLPHPIKKAQEKDNLPYGWGNFARQNELAKQIIRQAHFIYMDIDTMLTLRPDGHLGPRPGVPQDCLHYSIPGPLDVVFYLFYNTLLLLT